MRRPTSARLALLLILSASGSNAVSADSLSLPFEEYTYRPAEETTTYVERSLNHQAPLTVEHPPIAQNPYGQRGGSAAIAGFCREGGVIRRRDEYGNPVILRQREICDNVAPRQLWPGHVNPRPVWPQRAIDPNRPVLTTKG